MSAQWPITVKDSGGVVRIAGHAKGVPPIAGKLGVLQVRVPFNLPGLAAGVAIGKSSPIDPEVILAAWFDLVLPWDVGAVTPMGDLYTPQLLNDEGKGLIALTTGSPFSMRTPTFTPGGFRYGTGGFFWPAPGSFSPLAMWHDTGLQQPDQPWYFVVSQDGTPTGGDPSATAGAALLNMLIASPV